MRPESVAQRGVLLATCFAAASVAVNDSQSLAQKFTTGAILSIIVMFILSFLQASKKW